MMAPLKFQGYHKYSDTDRMHRRWTFTKAIDVPFEAGVDWLLFDGGPDVDPAKRFHTRKPNGDHETARHLEPWQVAALFGGTVPEWNPPKPETPDPVVDGLKAIEHFRRELDKLRAHLGLTSLPTPIPPVQPARQPEPEPDPEPEPRHPALARAIPDGPDDERGVDYTALEVTRDIPGTDLTAGTLLLWFHWNPRRREWGKIHVSLRPVPRTDFPTIVGHSDAFRIVERPSSRWEPEDPLDDIVGKMRRIGNDPRAGEWKLDTTRLWILPDLVEAVSEPIEAASDDAAIFELLASVGCRMPAGG